MVRSLYIALAMAASHASAQLKVSIGSERPIIDVITGFSSILIAGVVPIFGAVLTIGGVIIAAAHGDESWVGKGKQIVTGGVIGFCVAMGSYGIFRMILKFIYA